MKHFKTISNIVYTIGCIMVLVLGFTCFLGPKEIVNPNAMLLISFREQAFYLLAFGSVPMLAACFAVYFLNKIHLQQKKLLKFFLVFIPGIICAGCVIFIIGVVLYGFIINWPPGI